MPNLLQRKQRNPYLRMHRIPCVNASASATIPAFGLVRITGTDSKGVSQVDQPNTDGQDVYVNGPLPIPPSGYGIVSKIWPQFAAYDSGSGTPAIGDTWGAASGSYLLTKGKTGFTIQGAPNATQKIVLIAAATATTSLVGSSSVYQNLSFPSDTLVTCGFSSVTAFGSGQALYVSGSNLKIIAKGWYRWWFTVRWQFNPVVPGNYGAWMTHDTTLAIPPEFTFYDAGSLIQFGGGASGSVPNVPNPGVTIGPLIQQFDVDQILNFQLWQDTGQAVTVYAIPWVEKVG